jgi:hypothetical protein
MTVMQDVVDEIARVRYSAGQYLGAADFQVEQQYHRRALGRHQLGGHTWGIVAGFQLTEVPDPADPQFVDAVLTPGKVVDGYGRQVVSFTSVVVDPALFDAFTNDAHRSVWIEYVETAGPAAPQGFADCRVGQPTRAVETFRLLVDPVTTSTDIVVDGVVASFPPAPPGTPEIPADGSVPYQELPEEPPLGRWLVRLGSLRWDGSVGRFRPAAAGRLTEHRRYVGAIAAEVLAPAETLRIGPRTAATNVDAADFATVEGRLRAQGRVNAEREVWLEGHPIRFTYTGGAEESTEITLGRDHGSGTDQRLRLRLGDDLKATTMLSIGTKIGAGETTVAELRADGTVSIPTGLLTFGSVDRQEISLSGTASGIGTQPGSVYFRSPSEFAWYRGGAHSGTVHDPGLGGQMQLVLDNEGALDFGARTHQMLHLWSGGADHQYGIGVQPFTLYFRTDFDVCWFRRGSHIDLRGNPGAGGTMLMKLDQDANLSVFGEASTRGNLTVGAGGDAQLITRHVRGKLPGSDGLDSLFLNWGTGASVVVGDPGSPSNLVVSGDLRVQRPGQGAIAGVVKVATFNKTVRNQGSAPGTWTHNWAGQFDEVYQVYASLTGFSINDQLFDPNPNRFTDLNVIPQHLWVTVDSSSTAAAAGRGYCAQSDATQDGNNVVAFTLVVIGRKWT